MYRTLPSAHHEADPGSLAGTGGTVSVGRRESADCKPAPGWKPLTQ